MLRTNLSTRPFYNERGVLWAMGLAAVAIAALTIFNVTRIVSLSREQARLSGEIAQDESRTKALATQAAQVRASINQTELERIIVAARDANAVIDERTFSWTELFNQIERTLPPGVMLTAVTPRVDPKTGVNVAMVVIGREVENVDSFIEKLEETGKFSHVLANSESITDEGLFQVTLSGEYRPAGTASVAPVTPPPAGAAPSNAPVAGTTPAPSSPATGASPGQRREPAPPANGTPRKAAAAAEVQS